jgi:NADPH-dependent curcumin reductase CurA
MPRDANRQILLAARPVGCPRDEDFRLVESPIPGPGQFLVRSIYFGNVGGRGEGR